MRIRNYATIVGMTLLVTASCGDEPLQPGNNSTSTNTVANNTTVNGSTNGSTNTATNNSVANNTTSNNGGTNAAPNASTPNGTTNNGTPNGNPNSTTGPCDWEAVNGVVTIEAENLPLNEDWEVGTDTPDFNGSGYAFWSGQSYNNDPTHGVMSIAIRVTEPGRYQLEWRAQIGMGTNTTEHNDAWVRFPDAADYYGLKGESGAEIRRYSKPICEDQTAMDAIVDEADVVTADCARGSTRDGWMKVYGAGQDWRWGANTSDNDASRVTAEFPAAGVYTLELAARADLLLLDTVVLHLESIDRRDVRDLPETRCE